MPSEHLLDVHDLPPPEPLERVLAAIHALGDAHYLRVRLPREPLPLYALLEQSGFSWQARPGRDMPFEIFIWRRGDTTAQSAVQHIIGGA